MSRISRVNQALCRNTHNLSADFPRVSNKNAAVLSLVEPCIGIICACLPILPRLIHSRRNQGKDCKEGASAGESKFSLLRAIQSRLRSQNSSHGTGYVDLEESGLHQKASHGSESTGDAVGLQPLKADKITRETPRNFYERD